MTTPLQTLQDRLCAALTGLVDDPAPYVAMLKPTQDPRHGDYQANCAMALAKVWGAKQPREAAQRIVDRIPLDALLEPPAIAGPGFINFRLKNEWLAEQVRLMAVDSRLGVAVVDSPRTFVIDFSSPNVAKPMHVGHLRSTIIGDAIRRLLSFLGHKVISDNHLGDWGQQFGILIYGYKNRLNRDAYQADPVHELARLYVEIKKGFKSDEEDEAGNDPVQQACRMETAKLHAGDPENLGIWREIMPYCLADLNAIYDRLNVSFDYTHGESYYQPMLAAVVADLQSKGIAVETDGALGIFLSDRPDDPPALVRKRDGAFTYTTTDLATVKDRIETFKADELLYVVDSRQSLHFKNLFLAAKLWGYTAPMIHIAFGSVLDEQGRPYGTSKGGVPLLVALLDEAEAAAKDVLEKSIRERLASGHEVLDFTETEKTTIYAVVGIGAVKYADLSQNRLSDYRFSPEKMTDTDGNTATYMQYAYARNRSIFRKGNEDPARFRTAPPPVRLDELEERALALQLLRFGEALHAAAAEYKPNIITAYLWDLAKTYSGFFTNCPVLKAPDPALRDSRLLLCDLTARVIQQGLNLLGIKTVERM
jgi:arginyl-tRNA synthetase